MVFKLISKTNFSNNSSRMNSVENIKIAINLFNLKISKNLNFLLHKRYDWMNNFISPFDKGLEVGAGAGFSKKYIKSKNFKTSDINEGKHLDYNKIDALNTKFEKESFDFVIASNMIHHVPYPTIFFKEINRILKPNGKLIIFDCYSSVLLQLVTIIMRHEGFNFDVNVWDEKNPVSKPNKPWDGNIAVTNLIFDDKKKFKKKLGNYFSIEYEKFTECLIFLNSGGVTSKTFYIPMNYFFLKILNYIDKILIKLLPNIFCLGRRIVLKKIN